MDEKFLKPYDPAETEDRIYKLWEESGFFNPDECIKAGHTNPDAETFSIVLPPPNVTGVLHLGHSFEDSIQDALIRFNRMRGKKTLWIPGTDHAAIATNAKFEKELYKKENKSRHDFPREKYVEMVTEFALDNQSKILGQLRQMGSSLDWSRLSFTLDEKRQNSVFEAFKRMHEAGLIYQKVRVVNWDPKGQTTISDAEVIHEDRKAKMYTFKYSSDFPFAISTTRPETKLGDTAVAVHPDDARYKKFIGQEFSFNFAGEDVTVKVIADEYVDPEFGTGALGVTPAHSIADWEISERHKLRMVQVINEYGKMMVGIEGVKDVKSAIAREKVAEWLKENNLLEKEEDVDQSVGTAERTGAIIEPLPKLQWWIDVNKKFPFPHDSLKGINKGQEISLSEVMLHVVENGEVKIAPERFDKTYRNWVSNLRDWNISRQIVYGHRIPVWYKDGESKVSQKSPADGWIQDEDTLDTWFSSGLWTFSTLGWPEKTSDLDTYHPTNVVNPGYEILPLWVARMIMMSTFLVGQIPFETALIHGMLRDAKGQKFSKSLDNGIDPIDVVKQYGTDALRMSLIIGVTPGQDMSFGLEKVKAYKKFSNKLWNITRFVLENTEGTKIEEDFKYQEADQKNADERDMLIKDITDDIENYRLYLAGEKLYHYTWHEFADKILEESKKIIEEGSDEEVASRKHLLAETLIILLKALHPLTPFITEEIWQSLPYNKDTEILMVSKWPN